MKDVPAGTESLRSRSFVLFFISFSVISFQIALLRSLSFIRYYHFAYLVIGTALLGFGASGTFLALVRKKVERTVEQWISFLSLLFAVSIPICYMLAMMLPLDVQYLFVRGGQLLLLTLVVLILAIPFFLGALLIAIFLSCFSSRVHFLYGINLLGSGAGGICTLPLMPVLPPDRFPIFTALPAAAAALVWFLRNSRDLKGIGRRHLRVSFGGIGGVAVLLCGIFFLNYSIPADQYKTISMLQRLEKQGDAEHLAVFHNGRSRLDLFSSPVVHQTLFVSPAATALPPEQELILEDGTVSGVLFSIETAEDAGIVDLTPQSLPYRLTRFPRVLLLADGGNVNIWLGERFNAKEVVLIHPDPRVLGLIEKRTQTEVPVKYISGEPRLYLEQNRGNELFDIIHIANAETLPAAGGGLGSLNENYMLTVEGIKAAFSSLTSQGYISVTRGIQNPPRDNIRVFRLFARVLKESGLMPEMHLLQGRNYLAANTILSKSSLGKGVIDDYIRECGALAMDPEYYPGIPVKTESYRNIIEGPDGSELSWYRFAAEKVIAGGEAELDRMYLFHTDPPIDDSPYFHHFFSWKSLGEYWRAYGGMLFQKIEMGFIILMFTLVIIIVAAFLLILLPLLVRHTDLSGVPGLIRGGIYFRCIGLSFMFLEIISIQKFGLHLGSPVFSAAAAITSILLFAGAGSMVAGKISPRLNRPFMVPLLPLLVLIILYLFLPDILLPFIAGFSQGARFVIVIFFLAPPAFFMGWFFPLGLSLYRGEGKPFIPYAWGINGTASVAASPLAVLLSMTFGFRFVMVFAALLYTVAALSISGLIRTTGK